MTIILELHISLRKICSFHIHIPDQDLRAQGLCKQQEIIKQKVRLIISKNV